MQRVRSVGYSMLLSLSVSLILIVIANDARAEDVARGVVYHDQDGDGVRDPTEPGLAGVRVSNGRDVIATDDKGRYQLSIHTQDIIFVIKPRDYMTPVNAHHIPRFYYVHKPKGSPKGLAYRGVSPTGPLPESIDFPLRHRPEPDKFQVVVCGDPQPRTMTQVHYFAHDIVDELLGIDAAFGVSLGDIVFDKLELFEPCNAVIGAIGIPWYNIHGNHDVNRDAVSDELSDETWERVYGPTTYSFDWGPVHFLVLDNVMFDPTAGNVRYRPELGRHLTFARNDLEHVPADTLVVLMMHIPIVSVPDREALFKLLQERPNTFSLSAHWHFQQHFFLGPKFGWKGEKPHHHLVHATACGGWWKGGLDEFGIPHATMRDGAPNGYSIITFDRSNYSIRFKAARRPAREQMSIYLPNHIDVSKINETRVVVNVYAGSERSRVGMRVSGRTEWIQMKHSPQRDPYYQKLRARENQSLPPARQLDGSVTSPHIWTARLPGDLRPGRYVVEVRTVDMFDQWAVGQRVFTVK